ncbi:MAG: hypothetical protein HRU15_13420 [Planctomycetes bacterium]|nr:hypothetical protein [Planctomycetota bacterium]
MRHDFQKLLCECYKEGRAYATSSGNVRRRLKQLQADEDGGLPPQVSRSKYITNRKSFGENLTPLKRYIDKQVGRPWAKVYSDICAHNSKAGAVGLHIFQHLYWYIYSNVSKDEHKCIFAKAGGKDRAWRSDEIIFGSLYVDPEDGIIKRYRKNKCKEKPSPTLTKITIDDLHSIEQDGGIWYAFTWKACSQKEHIRKWQNGQVSYYGLIYCLREKKMVSLPPYTRFASEKRQLNKHELQKHKISNSKH